MLTFFKILLLLKNIIIVIKAIIRLHISLCYFAYTFLFTDIPQII